MHSPIPSHALWGEAAVAAYEDAEVAEYDGNAPASQVCRRFAQASIHALIALVARRAGQFDPDCINLLLPLAELTALDQDGITAEHWHHARRATRCLAMTAVDVGPGYLATDLFDDGDIAEAKAGANLICDWMCRELLGLPLETVQLRFHPARERPFTDAELWRRRRLAQVRRARSLREAAAASATADRREV